MATVSSERQQLRAFADGAFEFVVETANADDRRLIEALFRDVPPPDGGRQPLTAFSLIRSEEDADSWMVTGPYMGGPQASTLGNALQRLMAAVNRCVLDAEPECLHLHAGAATQSGRAVIVAAPSEVGKTTTIAHLVARGWTFLTDESVRLLPGVPEITGMVKPLSIKPGGEALVEHLEPWMIPAVGESSGSYRFVPIGASGASTATRGLPRLVVILRRPTPQARAPGAVAHPSTRRSVVNLMRKHWIRSVRARPCPARHAGGIATASNSDGYPEETVDEIETRFRLDPPKPLAVRCFRPSDAFVRGRRVDRVGDRAVVHERGVRADLRAGRRGNPGLGATRRVETPPTRSTSAARDRGPSSLNCALSACWSDAA